jgi:putative transposase
MRRRLAKDRRRLHGWMANGHYSAANHLLCRFDVLIAPKLPAAALVPRAGRVVNSATARAMLTWSHGLFAQRLQSAAFRYAGRHVLLDSGEPGTSRTCAHCGHWHAGLGGGRVFHCPACGVRMDRDVAGARNNFFAAYGRSRGIGWDGVAH